MLRVKSDKREKIEKKKKGKNFFVESTRKQTYIFFTRITTQFH